MRDVFEAIAGWLFYLGLFFVIAGGVILFDHAFKEHSTRECLHSPWLERQC